MTRTLKSWAAGNWFVLLLPLLLLIEFAFTRSTPWDDPQAAELAILFDLCVFVPALYALCYRAKVPLRTLTIRTGALVLAGLYLASLIVPAQAQTLLVDLIWARNAGWGVILLAEIVLAGYMMKLVYGGARTEEIARASGAPLWIVRLMQLEARFWKALWRAIRGR